MRRCASPSTSRTRIQWTLNDQLWPLNCASSHTWCLGYFLEIGLRCKYHTRLTVYNHLLGTETWVWSIRWRICWRICAATCFPGREGNVYCIPIEQNTMKRGHWTWHEVTIFKHIPTPQFLTLVVIVPPAVTPTLLALFKHVRQGSNIPTLRLSTHALSRRHHLDLAPTSGPCGAH